MLTFSRLIVAFQDQYNTPVWSSQGRACPSCYVWMDETPDTFAYIIGEHSAVIYGLCKECAVASDDYELLKRIGNRLTGDHSEVYYSLVYGDPDCTEGWGPKTLH